jgi:hypothetical protein
VETVKLKQAPGRDYDRRLKKWLVPCFTSNIEWIRSTFPRVGITSEVEAYAAALDAKRLRAAQWRDCKTRIEDPDMPVKGEPYQHQIAAYKMCLELLK